MFKHPASPQGHTSDKPLSVQNHHGFCPEFLLAQLGSCADGRRNMQSPPPSSHVQQLILVLTVTYSKGSENVVLQSHRQATGGVATRTRRDVPASSSGTRVFF